MEGVNLTECLSDSRAVSTHLLGKHARVVLLYF